MPSKLKKTVEAASAALLLALFLTFLLQIVSRYLLDDPLGWTLELSLMLWIWIVFWGNAFIVHDRQHVRFDLIYQASPGRIRRWFALVSALVIALSMALSLYPTWDYISFVQIQKSASLRIPFSTVFSVYLIFLAAVALSYACRAWLLIRGIDPDTTSR